MKTDTIVLALAAVAVYLIVQNKAGAKAIGTSAAAKDTVNEILAAGSKAFDNGWRYFTDGTTISPAGDYYRGGNLVYLGQSSGKFEL